MAIKKDITVTVENKKSIMSDSVWIYQGDKNIDIYFTIVDNRFEFSTVTPQRYSFTIRKPDGNLLPPTEITALIDNKVKFTITQAMADELNEVGMYDILIHLYDDLDSRISIPEISFEVKQPLVTTNALTSSGFVESAVLDSINDKLERLDVNGNYAKTVWSKGDVITKENLNKIENQLGETSSQLFDITLSLKSNRLNVQSFGLTSGKYINDYFEEISNYALTNKMTLYFPKGTYYIRHEDKSFIFEKPFVPMEGDGMESKIIFDNTILPTDKIFNFTTNSYNYNAFIRNLCFDCLTPYGGVDRLFNFTFTKDSDIFYKLKIENNYFGKFDGYKIYTTGWSNGGFNNCYFQGNVAYGCFLYSSSFGDSNVIERNSLYGHPSGNIPYSVVDVTQTNGSANCSIMFNNCSCGIGVYKNMINALFLGNQVECGNDTVDTYALSITSGNTNKVENCNLNGSSTKNCLELTSVNSYVKSSRLSNPLTYFISSPSHLLLNSQNTYYPSFNITKINGYVTNVVYTINNNKVWYDDTDNVNIQFLGGVCNLTGGATFRDFVAEFYKPIECNVDGTIRAMARVTSTYSVTPTVTSKVWISLPINRW